MPAIIGAEHDKTLPCQMVHVGNITFGGAVLVRGYIPMVEDDNGPTCLRAFTEWQCQKGIVFITLGLVGG